MRIELRDGLAFVAVRLRHGGRELVLNDVVLDTGSAGTVFSTESLATLGLVYEPEDPIHQIQGVGGSEFAFVKRIDLVSLGEIDVGDFTVEVSAMDYGFALGGIVGLDILLAMGAVIDLQALELTLGS